VQRINNQFQDTATLKVFHPDNYEVIFWKNFSVYQKTVNCSGSGYGFSFINLQSGKQATIALWRVFGEEVLYDLYHVMFPQDNTVLLKETLPTLTHFFNVAFKAWLIVRDNYLAVNIDIDIPRNKTSFINVLTCFEHLLPAVC